MKALERLEALKESNGPLLLWKGYALRNLGKALRASKCVEDAERKFQAAIRCRNKVFGMLEHSSFNISGQIDVEISLADMDQMVASGEASSKFWRFEDQINDLLNERPRYKLGGVWRTALIQSSETVKDLQNDDKFAEHAAKLALLAQNLKEVLQHEDRRAGT